MADPVVSPTALKRREVLEGRLARAAYAPAASVHSAPVVTRTLKLLTQPPQRLLESHLRATTKAFYDLDVILRSIVAPKDEDGKISDFIDTLMDGIAGKLDDIAASTTAARDRLNKLAEDKAVPAISSYTHAFETNYLCHTPQAVTLIEVITAYDQACQAVDRLWMHRVYKGREKHDEISKLRQPIITFCRETAALAAKARDMAANAGVDTADLDQSGPDSTAMADSGASEVAPASRRRGGRTPPVADPFSDGSAGDTERPAAE